MPQSVTLTRLFGINSNNADAHFNAGVAKRKLGNDAEAAQDFQKALSLAQEVGDEKLIANT